MDQKVFHDGDVVKVMASEKVRETLHGKVGVVLRWAHGDQYVVGMEGRELVFGSDVLEMAVPNRRRNFEDVVFEDVLPVNSLACLDRIVELLHENKVNSISLLKEKSDAGEDYVPYLKVRALLWFLNSQAYGQLGEIDMSEEWNFLRKELKA